MIGVEVRGDINTALRSLQKAMERDQVHTLIKRRLTFVTPSLRRRAKAVVAAKRRREAERKKEKFMKRHYERTTYPKRSELEVS